MIHASSYYSHNPKSIGLKSFDGRTYVGGFGLRMDPNGHNAEVIFQNTRNLHAMVVTSFGDVLSADNDDPTHSRATWVMPFWLLVFLGVLAFRPSGLMGTWV